MTAYSLVAAGAIILFLSSFVKISLANAPHMLIIALKS